WIAALRAAHTAADPALGAYILSSMAHQAAAHGRGAEAATLVETALLGARGQETPALLACLHSNQAYAKAILQDGSGCADAGPKGGPGAREDKPRGRPAAAVRGDPSRYRRLQRWGTAPPRPGRPSGRPARRGCPAVGRLDGPRPAALPDRLGRSASSTRA